MSNNTAAQLWLVSLVVFIVTSADFRDEQKQMLPKLSFYRLCLMNNWIVSLNCIFYVSSLPQLRSYNRHTLVADPYEDGLGDLLIKKQKMIELEKKVWLSASVAPLNTPHSPTLAFFWKSQ